MEANPNYLPREKLVSNPKSSFDFQLSIGDKIQLEVGNIRGGRNGPSLERHEDKLRSEEPKISMLPLGIPNNNFHSLVRFSFGKVTISACHRRVPRGIFAREDACGCKRET